MFNELQSLIDYQSRVSSGINEADELINSLRVSKTCKLLSIICEKNVSFDSKKRNRPMMANVCLYS